MNTGQIIKKLNGKKIEITKMLLRHENDQLVVSWELYCDRKAMSITFYHVSRLSLTSISVPIEVQGFEIIDHSHEGWANDSKYEIRDYEDDCIHFFCDDFCQVKL